MDDRRSKGLEYLFKNQDRVHRKLSKPVSWNGMVFESITKLSRHLGYENPTAASRFIREKKPIKGHMATFIKRDKGVA